MNMYTLPIPYSEYNNGKGLNPNYLTILGDTLQHSLNDYNRVFALRVDLHLSGFELIDVNRKITRFIDSLKAQLKACELKRSKRGTRIYPNTLRYVWAKETGTKSKREHYHLLLLFNKDAYYRLGDYTFSESLAYKIEQAWYGALSISKINRKGLVHFPKNSSHYIDKNSNEYENQVDKVMYRGSYLCKNYSKVISPKVRSFGSSTK